MPCMFARWKLFRKRDRVLKEIPPPEPDEYGQLAYRTDEFTKGRFRELRSIDKELGELATDKLVRKAQRLDVPIPSIDSVDTGTEYEETPEFRAELRKLVDDEKTRRREVAGWWWTKIIIPALSVLIGLIGAITGLVAVIHHK
jgi:hypothetical protein